MIEVGGRPLLDIWLDALQSAGVDEVLVNLHHLPEVVTAHLDLRQGGPSVCTFFEPELLGSAGTLLAHKDWVKGEDLFLACYADNLTDFDLGSLVSHHRQTGAVATLTVFHTDNPSACGIVQLDDNGRVVGFVEKPSQPKSNLANAGMYAFDTKVLDLLGTTVPLDIGYHLLPRLVGRSRALPVAGYVRDIGTPESYQQAQRDWAAKAPR